MEVMVVVFVELGDTQEMIGSCNGWAGASSYRYDAYDKRRSQDAFESQRKMFK
jgi:hypothetical protein